MSVYGLALLGMGVQSYFFPLEGSESSIISLIAAGVMGLIVLGMVWLSYSKPRPAYIVTIVVAVMALGRFAPKATTDIYPAGVTVALSVLVILVLAGGHFKAMADRKKAAAVEEA